MSTNPPESIKQQLLEKLEQRTAQVGVIGLGYVGLPLAVLFASSGFKVTGIDTNPNKVDAINRGACYIDDVDGNTLAELVRSGQLTATTDYEKLYTLDSVSICVPTPLNKTSDPDVSHIISSAEAIAHFLHPGMVVVLESTTYPGTTRDVLLPTLLDNDRQLNVGRDFFLAFSPERIDPGRSDWTIANTPRVLGGITPECLEVASALYGTAFERVVPVSSPEAAETVKLLENTFRAVNIALVNEILLMCDRLDLDAWEVIEAAATKPFGFMKFTPGPGLGGHCIPIDPLYLGWKMKTLKYTARFIELATEINASMPGYWVSKVQDALNESGRAVRGSRVLVLGVTYKKNVEDLRESPALDIVHLLEQKGAEVSYHDPHIPTFSYDGIERTSVASLDEAVRNADCVVVATDHDAYNWQSLRRQARLWVDTRHAASQSQAEENQSKGTTR